MAKVKSNHKWAIAIGIGIALFPIHNLWLTTVTSIGGMATLFLPSIGAVLWIMAVLLFVLNKWDSLDWGEKRILIPLIVIVVSMGISGFVNGETFGNKISPLFMGIALLASYAVARSLGVSIFRMMIPFVCIGAMIAVIGGILNPGVSSGGMITNYCASAGFLIFGASVNQGKWQWVLVTIALAGVFFIGALEGMFIVGIIGVVVLARRDYNRYMLIPLGLLTIVVAALLLSGHLVPLYRGNNNLGMLFDLLMGKAPINKSTMNAITSQRWEVYVEAIGQLSPLGYGYTFDLTPGHNIHNVPLNIMNQVGPLAAIAWLGLSVYCAIKTKWHYAWVVILAMSVWDHYLWTQFGALWWCLIGASTASSIESDLIFRGKHK